jgi:hypothetical protein
MARRRLSMLVLRGLRALGVLAVRVGLARRVLRSLGVLLRSGGLAVPWVTRRHRGWLGSTVEQGVRIIVGFRRRPLSWRRPVPIRHGGQATEREGDVSTPIRASRRGHGERDNGQMPAEHYFTTDPTAPARASEVEFVVAGREYRLRSAGGVFSADRLDPGTAVLLRKAELPGLATTGRSSILECGYGPIACVLATTAPAATVYAVDVNAGFGADQGQRRSARARYPDLGAERRTG